MGVIVVDESPGNARTGADKLQTALDAAEALHRPLRRGLVAAEPDGHAHGKRGILDIVILRPVDFTAGIDNRTRRIFHERVEDLVHLLLGIMVGAGVGDDRRVRLEGDQRSVGLVDLGNGVFAASEADRPFPSRHVGSVDAERIKSALGENVPEHRGNRRLAAGADDRHQFAALERFGKRNGAVDDRNPQLAGFRQPGIGIFYRA